MVSLSEAEIADFEKTFDVDAAKRFFKHITDNDEIANLDFPISNLRKTLPNLINLSYAPDSFRDTDSPRTIQEEWSHFFDEDGCLRFDQTLPLLVHSPELNKRERDYYEQTLSCCWSALSCYNQKNEGAEYEFVAPLSSSTVLIPEPKHPYVHHVNFFAKRKNSNSLPELFFAEIVALKGKYANKVLRCCILTPRLNSSSQVAMPSDSIGILHPENVCCTQCNRSQGDSSDDDDDWD